ncbi:MAG: hypothetical protein A4E53_02665 [Pelotomaculum sp. PtaB.Bin104]|nr:MAG: hypothetical protein A4E53_02665 [Pelotomaculum sp. PtaB.Bin104]
MKTWYFKIDVNNIILDAIEYPNEGYIEVQLPDTHLPAGINGGWYKWMGTAYVVDDVLKSSIYMQQHPIEGQLQQLKDQNLTMQETINFLLGL